MTLNEPDPEYAHRKLRMIRRSVLDTTHVVVLTYSFHTALVCSKNQILKIVKHFDFGMTCDVISDLEVNNIRFPSTNFPDLSNAV